VRLVELPTFSAAAKDLGIRQSTASKWLASLEEELGVVLIERTTRQRHVTEAGRRFYHAARELLANWAQITATLADQDNELRGRLRVSVPVVFGQRFVTPLLSSFAAAHPRLELHVSYTDRYVNLVEDAVDVAVRVGLPVDSSFVGRT